MASMIPSESAMNEIAQLKDIHLPDPIHWWPLATGWYVISIMVIGLFIAGILAVRHYMLSRKSKKEALRLLALYEKRYQQDKNSQVGSARISELLKRVALVYFPRQQVASLQGEAWITFLNTTSRDIDFNQVRDELLILPYQSKGKKEINTLFNLSRAWIVQRRKPCLD